MRRRQAGQALAGTLVVMMFAFLLAGAVAVAASALLSQKGGSRDASSRDLGVQDAVAAAVAKVAGHGNGGGGGDVEGGGNGAGSAVCSSPSTQITLLPSGFVSRAYCIRVDGVPAGTPTLAPPQWSGSCGVVDLSAYSGRHFLFWFNARGATRVYIDSKSSVAPCAGSGSDCATPAASGAVWQVAVNCDLGRERGAEYLHLQSSMQSPNEVRLAAFVASEGSIYLLAAETGNAGGPDYEEADVWVSPDGSQTTLLYEAAL